MKKLVFFLNFVVVSASVFGVCGNFEKNVKSDRATLSGYSLRNVERKSYVPAAGTGYSQYPEKDDSQDLSFVLSSLDSSDMRATLSQLKEQTSFHKQDSIHSVEDIFFEDVLADANANFLQSDLNKPEASSSKRKRDTINHAESRWKGKEQDNSAGENSFIERNIFELNSQNSEWHLSQSQPPKKRLKLSLSQNQDDVTRQIPRLALDLSNRKISKLPDEIWNLEGIENLEILNLSDNDIEKLPDTIVKLKNLKEISLVNSFSCGIWPVVIESLPNLKKLNIDDMQFTLWKTHIDKLFNTRKNFTLNVWE